MAKGPRPRGKLPGRVKPKSPRPQKKPPPIRGRTPDGRRTHTRIDEDQSEIHKAMQERIAIYKATGKDPWKTEDEQNGGSQGTDTDTGDKGPAEADEGQADGPDDPQG